MRDQFVVGVDIGSGKIAVALAGLESGGGARYIGHASVPSDGIIAGEVLDADALSDAVGKALAEARRIAGREVTDLYVTASGIRIAGHERTGRLDRTGAGNFSPTDVMRALPDSVRYDTRDERTIHRVVQAIAVDGIEVDDPSGSRGMTLAVRTRDYTAPRRTIDALTSVVQRAGCRLHAVVPAGVAAGSAALTDGERQLGVVVIDIGHTATDVGIYCAGALFDLLRVPLGGFHISADISQLMDTSYRDAERLKRVYGAADPTLGGQADLSSRTIEGWLRQAQNGEVPRDAVLTIAGARLTQIFGRIMDGLSARDVQRSLIAGAVLTGGTSNLAGIDEVAAAVLGMDVRPGGVIAGDGFPAIADPVAAGAVGLVRYCVSRSTSAVPRRPAARFNPIGAAGVPPIDWRSIGEPMVGNRIVISTDGVDSRRLGNSVTRWMRDFIPARHSG